MRMIVHAGFHKTGTTSVQQMLRENRAQVEGEFRLYMRGRIRAVCEAARAWSIRREALEMSLYHYELAQWFEGLSPDDPRPVLVSAEDLAGHMPGRHRLLRYDATAPLMAGFCEIAAEMFPGAAITFCLSLRQAGGWMRSAHAQNIRATRSVERREDYLERMAPHVDLARDAEAVRQAVAGQARVVTYWLEDCAGPLGPLDPLLDVAGASTDLRRAIAPIAPTNKSLPDDKLERLRVLNGTDLDRVTLHERKRQIMLEPVAGSGPKPL